MEIYFNELSLSSFSEEQITYDQLKCMTDAYSWVVRSNVEAGEGFADIIVEPEDPDAGIILELKYSKEAAGLEKACQKAIHKMKEA